MALLATGTARKSSFFKAAAPNYRDFSSPPNGDYVRYVDGLMRWAEEEQERLRLQALSDKARSQRDSHWGRSSAPTSGMREAQAQAQRQVQAQPGSVDSPMERWKRKAQASAAKLQQAQAAAGTSARTAPQATPKAKPKQSVPLVLAVMAIFVLTGIFASSLLPVVIIGWVVFNVIRAVRAASSASKS